MPSPVARRLSATLFATACLWLGGCDMLGIESSEKVAAARDADGRAIGGACRHAARAIEDCYGLNKKADKAAIFAGWRDMNDYMRENKIESVPSQMAGGKAQKHGGDDAPQDADTHEAKANAHEAKPDAHESKGGEHEPKADTHAAKADEHDTAGGEAPAAHPHAEPGERHAMVDAKAEKATKAE